MRSLLVILLLTLTPLLAQEMPIEIDLIPPPEDSGISIEMLPRHQPEPTWEAPPEPCDLCHETARTNMCGCFRPLTQGLANELFEELGTVVNTTFGGQLKLPGIVSVRVVSAARLRQMGGEPVLGLYENRVIWLSQDLNRRRALAVMAHEYGHAWHYLHRTDIDAVPELLFEGFAEWVSYRVVQSIGDRKSVASIRDDQSIYGRGARWFIRHHRAVGLEGALATALSKR